MRGALDVRSVLEQFARHDNAFHRRIVQAADNDALLRCHPTILLETVGEAE